MSWFGRPRQRSAGAGGDPSAAPPGQRWLVLDVESSGLDPRHDDLLAIAAVALRRQGHNLQIMLGDSFEVVLQREVTAPNKANVLLHGIGIAAQRAGMAPPQALREFAAFAGEAPLIGFHSAFDRALVERAQRQAQQPRLANPWLDLAELAPVLCPGAPGQPACRALDDWLARMGIPCAARHQAAADALATAELLLRLWPAALAQGAARSGFQGLARLAAGRRWLPA